MFVIMYICSQYPHKKQVLTYSLLGYLLPQTR
nr:MAG TPA: cAMP-dependent protein kinase inhibitor [Bacteriophage sp.]